MSKSESSHSMRRGLLWRVLLASAIAILLIGAGLWAAARAIGYSLQEQGMRTAESGLLEVADALHKRSQEGRPPVPGLTVGELMGWKSDFQRFGHFDSGVYIIQLRGSAPAFERTTIEYSGPPPQRRVVLTVIDLKESRWQVEAEEMPLWWEVWK